MASQDSSQSDFEEDKVTLWLRYEPKLGRYFFSE